MDHTQAQKKCIHSPTINPAVKQYVANLFQLIRLQLMVTMVRHRFPVAYPIIDAADSGDQSSPFR